MGECMELQTSCVHVFKYSHMARKIIGPIITAVYGHTDMGGDGLTPAISHIQVKFSISTTSTGMELSVQ